MSLWEPLSPSSLTPRQIHDLRLAASKMTGATRRAFQAEMTLQYCHGSARLAETMMGWSREAVEVGLAEHRTGIICVDAHAAFSGRKRWEEQYPEAAEALQAHGIAVEQLPSPSTMAEVLNRMGYRVRKGLKAKPQKKIKATDAILDTIKKRRGRRGNGTGQTREHRL